MYSQRCRVQNLNDSLYSIVVFILRNNRHENFFKTPGTVLFTSARDNITHCSRYAWINEFLNGKNESFQYIFLICKTTMLQTLNTECEKNCSPQKVKLWIGVLASDATIRRQCRRYKDRRSRHTLRLGFLRKVCRAHISAVPYYRVLRGLHSRPTFHSSLARGCGVNVRLQRLAEGFLLSRPSWSILQNLIQSRGVVCLRFEREIIRTLSTTADCWLLISS